MARRSVLPAALIALVLGGPALAAPCGNGAAGFAAWLAAFKTEAVAAGIDRRVVDRALTGLRYNPTVIKFDRSQRSFKMSFDAFYKLRVNNALIAKGKRLMQTHSRLLGQIEQRTGVPGAVLVSIWGLETGYGRNSGNLSVLRSLATLAYDCRRSALFTNELLAALRLIERGDLTPAQMVGAWAGELGQTQFLASSYVKFAVDGDGNGKRDLLRSVPDVLWSTANYLKAYGWQAGAGWGEGEPNYAVIRQWNRAGVYVRTISVMASRIAG